MQSTIIINVLIPQLITILKFAVYRLACNTTYLLDHSKANNLILAYKLLGNVTR
jgi:hypothetical protein